MIWHEISERKLDYSQVGQLGAQLMFACDGGTGQASAATAGFDMDDSVTIAGETCTVTGMDVATRDGIDYVSIRANTPDFDWMLLPGETDPEDTEETIGRWLLRFGSKLVPGDQVVGPEGETIATPPPPEVLMPQPTIMLEWRRTIDKAIPTTKAAALDMAATYALGLGAPGTAFESNGPKIQHTLAGAAKFLCTSIEVDEHPSLPAKCLRVASYEYSPTDWDAAIYPAGAEADPVIPDPEP